MSNKKFLELVPLDPADASDSPVLKKAVMMLDFNVNHAPGLSSFGPDVLCIANAMGRHDKLLSAQARHIDSCPPSSLLLEAASAKNFDSSALALTLEKGFNNLVTEGLIDEALKGHEKFSHPGWKDFLKDSLNSQVAGNALGGQSYQVNQRYLRPNTVTAEPTALVTPKIQPKLPKGTKTIVGTKGAITIPTVVKKPGNTFKRR